MKRDRTAAQRLRDEKRERDEVMIIEVERMVVEEEDILAIHIEGELKGLFHSADEAGEYVQRHLTALCEPIPWQTEALRNMMEDGPEEES